MEDVVEQAAARARKRYDLEDPQAPSWVLHRKHIFILSSAGKPIFSRYGDESKMAPLAGVLQALISFVRDTGDHIRHVRAGAHRMVFVTRGSLYLVGVSSSGDSVPYIARQLHFLHSQIISILTAKVEMIFQKNASFDLRGLLGGTDRVLRTLIREGSGEPTMLLQATPCLRMPAATRAELGRLLAATRPTALLFGVLLSRGFLVQLLHLKRTPLHPHDLLLVSVPALLRRRAAPACLPTCQPSVPIHRTHDSSAFRPTSSPPPSLPSPHPPLANAVAPTKSPKVMNTVNSSASFREDETWLPLCLPSFNDRAMLFAHISFVAPELCLVLITTTADAFAPLSLCRQQVVERLQEAEELRGPLFRAIAQPQYDVEEVGAAEIRHFIYRLAAHSQFTAPRTGPLAGPQCPYRDRASVKALLRRYQHAHQRVHAGGKPLREYLQTTETETIVAWTSSEHELYVVLGPLVSKPVAIAASHKLLRWLRKEQPTLFFAPVAK